MTFTGLRQLVRRSRAAAVVIALMVVAAQQYAVVHVTSHLDSSQQNVPTDGAKTCDVCNALANLGHAVANSMPVPVTQALPGEIHAALVVTSDAHSFHAYRSRAPPTYL
jgi:hypothetical protein